MLEVIDLSIFIYSKTITVGLHIPHPKKGYTQIDISTISKPMASDFYQRYCQKEAFLLYIACWCIQWSYTVDTKSRYDEGDCLKCL